MGSGSIAVDVGIVGGGPAGLMTALLLARRGVSAAVVEVRGEREIRGTQRAGILEAGTVEMLLEAEIGCRVLSEGHEHRGTLLSFDGDRERIDFQRSVGRSVWLYPQNEVFHDLSTAWQREGGTVFFGVTGTAVHGIEGPSPRITFADAEGEHRSIECRLVVGADGSRSQCRTLIPESVRTDYQISYPYAWFGILCQAPPTAPELIYASSEHGFALISQRNASVQRMYFQCDPRTDPADWDDAAIFDRIQRILGEDGDIRVQRGPIVEKTVLPFRSYVCDPLSHGRLALAGDAGHTVPPTGAKGLNLAFADVQALVPRLVEALDQIAAGTAGGPGETPEALRSYSHAALDRVWKAQSFSYWVTQLLHREPDENPFTHQRRRGEFHAVTGSEHGRAYFAQAYTGSGGGGTDSSGAGPLPDPWLDGAGTPARGLGE